MDFTDVVNDLIKLEGLCLHSIRPGANIVIEKVDIDQKRLTIRNASGKTQNRYFAELERIWDALLANPAIRVEDVLNGSGSSRNQPETIFANLPYIEWLKIDNKKHIAYVGSTTHSYGTLLQMNSAAADKIGNDKPMMQAQNLPTTLVVSDDLARTSKTLISLLGTTPTAISEGVYEFKSVSHCILLAGSAKIRIPTGTYSEIKTSVLFKYDCIIEIAGRRWCVCKSDDLKLIAPM